MSRELAQTVSDYAVSAMRTELAADGYETAAVGWRRPHEFTPMHTHPFATKVAVMAGELTLRVLGGAAIKYAPGDVFLMPRDTRHEEIAGADGAVFLIGSKAP